MNVLTSSVVWLLDPVFPDLAYHSGFVHHQQSRRNPRRCRKDLYGNATTYP